LAEDRFTNIAWKHESTKKFEKEAKAQYAYHYAVKIENIFVCSRTIQFILVRNEGNREL